MKNKKKDEKLLKELAKKIGAKFYSQSDIEKLIKKEKQ